MTNKIEFSVVAKYHFNSQVVGSLSVYGDSVPIVTRPVMRHYTSRPSVISIRFWRKDD